MGSGNSFCGGNIYNIAGHIVNTNSCICGAKEVINKEVPQKCEGISSVPDQLAKYLVKLIWLPC